MAANDSWKLLIWSIIIIIAIESVVNLTINSFEGFNTPSQTTQELNTMVAIANGTLFEDVVIPLPSVIPDWHVGHTINTIFNIIMPNSFIHFVIGQIQVFSYIPSPLQEILATVLFSAIILALYCLATLIIP